MKQYKILLLLIGVFFASCDDTFQDAFDGVIPNDALSEELVFTSLAGAEQALLGAYTTIRGANYYGRDIIAAPEMLADNLKRPISSSGRLTGQSTNDVRAHVNIWNTAFDAMNQLNLVIANIDGVPGSASVKQDIKGQALAFRGLIYHDLVKIYGRNPNHIGSGLALGVPLLTSPFTGLSGANAFPSRNNVGEIYTQIIADLNEAISLLDNRNLSSKFFISQLAAKAILARVHLYAGNWAEAANMADEVINETPFDLASAFSIDEGEVVPSYETIFANSSETIFEIGASLPTESLGVNNSINVFYIVDEDGDGQGDGVLRQDLIDLFDHAVDVRWQSLMVEDNRNGEIVYYNKKFDAYQGNNLDNVPVVRLAEMYLTRAEANFENGSSIGAEPVDDINAIRNRANLPDLPGVNMNDILRERRMELAFEGHRFFDLKRKGLPITKGKLGDDCTNECVIPNSDFRVVNNIDQVELDANSSLVQNPGYN